MTVELSLGIHTVLHFQGDLLQDVTLRMLILYEGPALVYGPQHRHKLEQSPGGGGRSWALEVQYPHQKTQRTAWLLIQQSSNGEW